MVSKGQGEVDNNKKKTVNVKYKPRVPYPNATRKDCSDEQFALSHMPNAMKFLKELLANKRKLDEASHVELNAEISLKEIHEPLSNNSKGSIHEERRLQINELDEWRTHKPRTHDKLKLFQSKLDTSLNQLTVGYKVLLDSTDPHIVTTTPNEEIPLTVLSIFPFGMVEVSHPKFGTFKSSTSNLLTELSNTGLPQRHGQAHGRAYGRVKIGQGFPQTRATIKCHNRSTWLWILMSYSRGKKAVVPASKKQKGASSSTCLLTTDPWELFFGIIEPTYLELTMELCSTFHLQTVMMNYDDLGTVQFRLSGLVLQLSVPEFSTTLGLYTEEFKEENELHALTRHIHFSPSSAGTVWPLAQPPTILGAPRHQFSHHP
ncbi:hypothetical protein GOBAR_AA03946 [Gossypium barbadense]|uniref:Uncharacterized protein n=1 Tax=Gossypium barbadense TaxID=3634 RepID=A0A2P5YM51_GOSBA|nr:hypothetical protein GOBAR_AA03946 [Gossypium barbadense]